MEALGVAASGIAVTQIATQVTSSIIKLKNYWAQVKDVPMEIECLLCEVSTLNLILSHMEQDQARPNSNSIKNALYLKQSLDLCQQGAGELGGLVTELATKVEGKHGLKQKLGSAKVVLKKDDLKRLKRRMKSAIRLLSLSYQCHTSAMIQLQPDILFARISNHTYSARQVGRNSDNFSIDSRAADLVPKSSSAPTRRYEGWTASPSWIRYVLGCLEYHKAYRKCKGKEWGEFIARYKFPGWVSYAAWDCRIRNTILGWQINLQLCRHISRNSPFFEAVYNQDTSRVRKMLLDNEAFVTDRLADEEEISKPKYSYYSVPGMTALHFAAMNGDLEMSRLLLSQGADALAIDDHNQ